MTVATATELSATVPAATDSAIIENDADTQTPTVNEFSGEFLCVF